ncbi:MAG: hypothetical protein GXW89_06565 [Phycisphaerae bacterium]|nr:hypothetical protein [Phycisphaerae bacterium]
MRTRHLINPLVARTRQGTLRTADPLASGPDPARQWFRRGNALIMAVSLTVLLAIIGSAFVLMSRMDRQSVVGVQDGVALDTATDYVLARIQRVLADDLVDNKTLTREPFDETVDVDGDGFTPIVNGRCDFEDLNGNGWYDFVDVDGDGVFDAGIDVPEPGEQFDDVNGNHRYDDPFQSLLVNDPTNNTDPFATREPYDAAWASPPDNDEKFHPHLGADLFLASTMPEPRSGGGYVWRQISEIFPAGANYQEVYNETRNFPVKLVPPTATPPDNPAADADGDGMADSKWREIFGIAPPGKRLFVAVRIIDNSALINVNTAWPRAEEAGVDGNLARLSDSESYGEFPHQIDLDRLLKRWGKPQFNNLIRDDINRLNEYRMGAPYTGLPYDVQTIEYYNAVIRNYGWFAPFAPWPHFLPFDLTDELELRNRFFINTTTTTRLEAAMYQSLGVYDLEAPAGSVNGYRILPFSQEPDAVELWYQQLTAATSLTDQRPDQRHLLTTLSMARDLRTTKRTADSVLDARLGNWRKVNINNVLETLTPLIRSTPPTLRKADGGLVLDATHFPTSSEDANYKYTQAVLRLSAALQGAGYTADDSIRFLANLIDYIDEDHTPTVIVKDALGTDLPSVNVYGTEIQPFITEICNVVDKDGNSKAFAVELFNPYPVAINTSGWQLRYKREKLIDLSTTQVVPANGGRVVYQVVDPDGSTIPVETSTGAVVVPATGLLPAAPDSTLDKLQLVRPSAIGSLIVLDVVPTGMEDPTDPAGGMEDVFTAPSSGTEANYIWRGLAAPPGPTVPAVAPWAWARCEFSSLDHSGHLGKIDKVAASDPLDKKGVAIHIANRGPITNSPTESEYWRVNGWHELSQILLTGNSDIWAPAIPDNETITEKMAKLDLNSRPEKEVRMRIMLSAVREPVTGDSSITGHDLTGNEQLGDDPAWESRFSFFSRADDGFDNVNLDGDNDPLTNHDSLMECAVPGRVNVNTAPEDVLKVLVPRLWDGSYRPGPAPYNSPPDPAPLSDTELKMISAWYARAIVLLREDRPFTSLGDLADRLANYSNPGGEIPGLPADYPGILRFALLVDVVKGRVDGSGNPLRLTTIGDPYLQDDAEERNWLINRMANLLTVRSDTFTAYFVIRLQSAASASNFIERRYVAILDRSNVFLPESAARNGSFWNSATGKALPPPYTDDSGEMAIYDPNGKRYGPSALNDPDYFDRQYVTPRVVALRQVPDPR